jgi:hypothetical protein
MKFSDLQALPGAEVSDDELADLGGGSSGID